MLHERLDGQLSACKNLERKRQVSRWNHASGLRYWTRRSSKPMSNASLASNVAFALYCNSREHGKIRAITLRKLEEMLKVKLHGLPGRHYLIQNETTKLGQARIDISNASIGRIIAKTRRLLRRYSTQKAMAELVGDGFFEITWIVANESKLSQLASAFQNENLGAVGVKLVAMSAINTIQSPPATSSG